MPKLRAPCQTCGELTHGNYCTNCNKTYERRRTRARQRTNTPKPPPHKRGYDYNWQKLSKRARLLQPWCSMCGTQNDLQADHTPEAWQRKAQGKPIRLQDIDVLCGDCNRKAGAARGEAVTRPYRRKQHSGKGFTHTGPLNPSDGQLDTLGGIPAGHSSSPRPRANSQYELMGDCKHWGSPSNGGEL